MHGRAHLTLTSSCQRLAFLCRSYVAIDSRVLDVLIGDAELRLADCLRRRDALLNSYRGSPELLKLVKRGDEAIAFIETQLAELQSELALARDCEDKARPSFR